MRGAADGPATLVHPSNGTGGLTDKTHSLVFARTPAPIVARLHELLVAGTKSASAKQFFESTGTDPWTTTPDELAKFQAAEAQKWGRVIKAAGIEPE